MRLASSAVWVVLICIWSWPAAAQVQPEQREVVVEPGYASSGLRDALLGKGYRGEWTTAVTLPVLDLRTMAGGLTPVRVVGQAQSLGLALTGADGRSYTFRSLHKHPERMLPEAWRDRMPAGIARDQTSHTLPSAAVVLPVLAEAAGVPHTEPRLVVMPDDPALGEFRAAFANEIGTIEVFPLPAGSGNPGFAGATAILSSDRLWTSWLEGPENRIDDRAFLRARVLDLWIDNFDRHRGQWRWMRVPGRPFYQALPEDPDMAFVHHDGLLMATLRPRLPRFLQFSAEYPDKLEGAVANNFEIDRWLLASLDADDWREVATDLQNRFTDAVIESAVTAMPPEWHAIDGERIASALRTRRAGLVDYALAIYRYYAEKVDIHATDRPETVAVTRAADNSVTVAITAAGESVPWYERRFLADDTKDVRIYLQGGDDHVTRTGPAGGPVRVRVVAGGGHDVIDDSQSGGTEVWRDAGTVEVLKGRGTSVHDEIWTNPVPVSGAPWIERRSFGHWTIPTTIIGGSSEIGVIAGYAWTRTAWDFRSEPNSSVQVFRAAIASARLPGIAEYLGTFRRPASHMAWQLRVLGSSIERHNFFGFGNDTPEEKRLTRYRTYEKTLIVSPTIRFEQGQRLALSAGPELRYSREKGDAQTVLDDLKPIGAGASGRVSLRAGLQFDSRLAANAATGIDAFASPADTAQDDGVSGVRTDVSGMFVPSVWDIESPYGGTEGLVAAYLGDSRAHLALRVGGQKMWGHYAWYDAAAIGGSTNRGFHSDRFTGDASAFGSVSFRGWLGSLDTPAMPIRLGVIVFADAGRVWVEGQDSTTWHRSTGAGLLAQPLGLPLTFHATIGHSREGNRIAIGAGYPF